MANVNSVRDWRVYAEFAQSLITIAPSDPRGRQLPLPQEIIGELLRYVVSHEIGHARGLRHNFKGHSAYSVARLRSKEWTQRWGNSASIMEYARLN